MIDRSFNHTIKQAPSGESFECDAKSELAKIDSIITEIKMPVKDAVYTVRNLMEKAMHNPGIVVYMNSSEQIKGGSWSGSDVSRLMNLMMPDIISGQGMYVCSPVLFIRMMPVAFSGGASELPKPEHAAN